MSSVSKGRFPLRLITQPVTAFTMDLLRHGDSTGPKSCFKVYGPATSHIYLGMLFVERVGVVLLPVWLFLRLWRPSRPTAARTLAVRSVFRAVSTAAPDLGVSALARLLHRPDRGMPLPPGGA